MNNARWQKREKQNFFMIMKGELYLYDKKVPVLVVFKAGLCVLLVWLLLLFSLMFVNGVPAVPLWAKELLSLYGTGAVVESWK
jgi:hypothetical protein